MAVTLLPESPDFKRIADVLLARLAEARSKGMIAEVNTVAEQLRQVWNARGAADIAMFEAELSLMVATKTTHERLAAALRSLDR